MAPPKVAVVIVHYRNYDDTARCLESLQQLEYSAWAAVVVDNSPVDPSGELLRQQYSGERFHFIKMSENLGFAAGCNKGANMAEALGAKYLWFLNPDTEVAASALGLLVEAAEGLGDVCGSLCSLVRYAAESLGIWGAGGHVNLRTRQIEMLRDISQLSPPTKACERATNSCDKFIADTVIAVDYSPGCSMLVPVQVWKSVGEFDESYFLYFEETDWCLRATKRGYRHYCVPQSVVKHYTSDAKLQAATVVYYYNRNSFYFWWRFSPWGGRVRLIADVLLKRLPKSLRARRSATLESERQLFEAHRWAAIDFLCHRRGVFRH